MRVFLRPLWFVALLAHVGGAALWWSFMPGGFPFNHSRFWVNRFLPVVVIGFAGAALVLALTRRAAPIRLVLLGLGAMWLAAMVAAPITFPQSGWWLALAMLLFGGATLGAALAARLVAPLRPRWAIGAAALGAAIGVLIPWTQRAADPTTHPVNGDIPPAAIVDPLPRTVALLVNRHLIVQTTEGVVTLRNDRYAGVVEPMLTFNSRSPDRCWTVLSPQDLSRRPRHRFAGMQRDGAGVRLAFSNPEGPGFLSVHPRDGSGAVDINSSTRLLRPVYSHLNSFCVVSLVGHRSAVSLRFSPCPDTPVTVSFADYPVGRPSRAAYVTAAGEFRIIEAATGEKGPFRTLATGRLRRGDPLTVTFYDGERAVMRATIRDWSAQASDALSPTAGWGVTQNAIEFGLENDYPEAPATAIFTLAGTSLGRGYDSVGHAAGTYRNRVEVELLE
jgi:hypothetical protein